MMIKNNSDILFLQDATNTNPNGDPDQENKPRMDYETKTLLLSDVRTKRTIRDFLANKNQDIFVGTLNDTKVTMEQMFSHVMEKYGLGLEVKSEKGTKKDEKEAEKKTAERMTERIKVILDHYIDIRLFGSAMAVGGITKTFTGPIQLAWGYSLHPVDIIKSDAIVTIMNDDNSTFGKMYKAHYALIAQSGTINKFAAQKTRCSEKDREVFRKALVQSLMNNLTHSKQGQQPLLYLEVVYNEGFDGYMGDMRRFLQVKTLKENAIRSLKDLEVDFADLSSAIDKMKKKGYVKDVLIWQSPLVQNFKNLPSAIDLDLLSAIK